MKIPASLVAIIAFFCVFQNGATSAQDLEILKKKVVDYCEAYQGYSLQIKDQENRDGKNFRFWLSDTGTTAQQFFQYTSDDTWRLLYCNGKYSLELSSELMRNGLTIFCAADDENIVKVFTSPGWCLAGRDFWQQKSYSEIVSKNASCVIEKLKFFGKTLPALVCKSDNQWFEFGFENEKLVYIGKRIEQQGEPKRLLFGPIIYDADGLPVTTAHHVYDLDENGEVTKENTLPDWNVISYKKLAADDLSSDRVNINEFGIPKILKAFVDSPVPYELRDGRLVKLIDGRSEKILEESAFRKPTFWSRWMYPLIAVVPLGLVVIVWWWRK